MDGNSLGWQAKFRCNRRTVPTSGPLLTWLVRTFISITDTAGHSKKKKKRRDIEEKIFESTLNKTLEHIRNLLDDFNYAESKREGSKCELKHVFDRFCVVKGHSDLQKDGTLRESFQIRAIACSTKLCKNISRCLKFPVLKRQIIILENCFLFFALDVLQGDNIQWTSKNGWHFWSR